MPTCTIKHNRLKGVSQHMGASDRNPQYYCPLRDRYVNISEADILVVSADAKEEYSRPEDSVADSNIALKRAH